MSDDRPLLALLPVHPADRLPLLRVEGRWWGVSAKKLREAAELLRSRAKAATCPCGGPICNSEQGWFREGELLERMDGSEYAVPYMLTTSPTFGIAVADWLDEMVAGAEVMGADFYALSVANAILGDPS